MACMTSSCIFFFFQNSLTFLKRRFRIHVSPSPLRPQGTPLRIIIRITRNDFILQGQYVRLLKRPVQQQYSQGSRVHHEYTRTSAKHLPYINYRMLAKGFCAPNVYLEGIIIRLTAQLLWRTLYVRKCVRIRGGKGVICFSKLLLCAAART